MKACLWVIGIGLVCLGQFAPSAETAVAGALVLIWGVPKVALAGLCGVAWALQARAAHRAGRRPLTYRETWAALDRRPHRV